MHLWYRNLSLRAKATCSVLLIVLIAVTATALVSVVAGRHRVETMTRHSIQTQARSLALACKDAIEEHDDRMVSRYIEIVAADPDIMFVGVFDAQGDLIASSARDVDAWILYRRAQLPDTRALIATRAVRSYDDLDPALLGHVTVGHSVEPLARVKREQATMMFSVVLLTTLVCGGAVFLTVGRWSRRIDVLAQASTRIAQGDMDQHIGDVELDEIGQLARSLEQMRQTVHDRDRALRRFNDLLQDEVDQRTQELQAAKETAEEAANCLRDANERLLSEVSERQRSEAALRQSEERYALAARGANDGLWDWDVSQGQIYYSPRWKQMLGYDDHEVTSSPEDWITMVHPDDVGDLRRQLVDHFDGRTRHFESEHRIRHRDGEYRWVLARGVAVRDDAGKAKRIAGSLTDMTDRKGAEAKLRHRALHDELTGLPNRTLLMDRMERCVARVRRDSSYHFAVFFMDLDRFKVVNDSLGHAAGDQLLIDFSRRLRSSLRGTDTLSRGSNDTLARLGGDEFVLLLESIRDATDVARIAQRIQDSLRQPFKLVGHEVYTSASIGVAVGTREYDAAEELLRDADMAMYRAKSGGRARFEVFDKKMHAEALERLNLENDLRRAIDAEQFVLNYQPIVSMNGGHIVGFEALIRWNHPHHGLVSPNQFIPIAEETGLIVPLGAWVVQEACRQLGRWRHHHPDGGGLSISVNLSKRQLSEPGLVDMVRQAIEDASIDGRRLKLEITESIVMEASDTFVPILQQLRALGCQIHIDDFGTGYSSLSCLHQFPLDVIKIDRAFIPNMSSDPRYSAVVNAIVTLAHNLGMEVTAEGVESLDQLSQVLSLEVDFCQGYYFSPPLDADSATALLMLMPPWLRDTAVRQGELVRM